MRTKVLCGWLIGALALAGAAMGQDTRDVTFTVDMSVQIADGAFTNGTGTVQVFGSFNSWAAGIALDRDGDTDLYTATFSIAGTVGDEVQYKFVANDWENDPNRSFNLGPAGTPQVLDTVYFNNQGPVGEEVTADVTFSVDMAVRIGSGAFDPDTMGVDVRGDFNEWGTTALAREGETSVYSGTISVTTNEGASVGYKFYYYSDVDNWEADPNRTFLMSADPQELDTVYFNNEEPVLIGLTLDGTWNPDSAGDYPFTLTRVGAVSNDIVLTSSNTNAVTVPAAVSFTEGSNSVSFNVTVVSLTEGPATIVASNEATGVWTDYTITPVAPTLAVGGPWELFIVPQPVQYTLTRTGAVGDNVSLTSSDPSVLAVPPAAAFAPGETETLFTATSMAYGVATILASNAAAQATFDVTVSEPAITIEGPATVWTGGTMYYTLRRNTATGIGHIVNLTSSDPNRLTVPDTVDFDINGNVLYFAATGVAPGEVTLTADNDDVEPAVFSVTVADPSGVLAQDDAGNYTPETFTNGANEGTGFGAWNLWGAPAALGDSTAGGGGDLNSTNGYSFRFMGDGAEGWCNGERPFSALQPGDVLSFTFTYNWNGGGRGVDLFSAGGQFANLIDVSPGDTFKVNGQTISTNYSPGAVVEVEITQQAGGIQLYLTRSAEGAVNLAYVTNIVHGEAATGVSMYCGGYVCDPGDNVNYAMFMNDLQIAGEEPTSLTFTGGTWDPAVPGGYEFELTRSGDVTDNIVLSSDNEAAVTVPAAAAFEPGIDTLTFTATVVSVTSGTAKIVASNEDTGAWAEYNVYPVAPSLGIDGPWQVYGLGEVQYTLTRTGAVGDEIAMGSSDEGVATVPVTATFGEGETAITFLATFVAYGSTTLTATDAVSGATADFGVTYSINPEPPIGEITFDVGTGDFSFAIPEGYDLGTVWGADFVPNAEQDWDWVALVPDTDYTVDAGTGVITILGDAAARRIIRIGWLPE
jgi:hypothetical protein